MNNGNIGHNHFRGGGSLHFTRRTLGTRIQLSRALMWDTDLLLVKCAVIPEAKRGLGPLSAVDGLGLLISANREGEQGPYGSTGGARKYLEVCRLCKIGGGGGWGGLGGASRFQNSHVHDVCFVQRLVFDLWVDDGWVGDPCGMWTWGAGHHVVREPVMTAD